MVSPNFPLIPILRSISGLQSASEFESGEPRQQPIKGNYLAGSPPLSGLFAYLPPASDAFTCVSSSELQSGSVSDSKYVSAYFQLKSSWLASFPLGLSTFG
jgi:hypothetical protein